MLLLPWLSEGVTACVTGLGLRRLSELSNGEVFLISLFGLSLVKDATCGGGCLIYYG